MVRRASLLLQQPLCLRFGTVSAPPKRICTIGVYLCLRPAAWYSFTSFTSRFTSRSNESKSGRNSWTGDRGMQSPLLYMLNRAR